MARCYIMPLRKVRYLLLGVIIILSLYLYKLLLEIWLSQTPIDKRSEEQTLVEALALDKGTGCEVPHIDPFLNNVIATFEQRRARRPKCKGPDWVQCHLSECRLSDKLPTNNTKDLKCTYRDLIYVNDWSTKLGEPVVVEGNGTYTLSRSDHVYIHCTAVNIPLSIELEWLGFKAGYRNVTKPEFPKDRHKFSNILLFAFDSTSRNGFIRKMPKSYKVLVEQYKSVILNKYNIVGDGTVAAALAFLVGRTELELPELRKGLSGTTRLEDVPFIFHELQESGYRTAYHEDSPWTGTFQLRLKGFAQQPTDHYLHPFNRNEKSTGYCLGDRLRYSVMIDLTRQFFKLSGPKFMFTFVADISHDDSVRLRWADDEFADFLTDFMEAGHLKDTAVFIMGDHGPRFAKFRATYEGKIEERLPLLAIRLPSSLPAGLGEALATNRDTLTTPFDLHATLLQLTGLDQFRNTYRVPGADMMRGLSLLEKISENRSCAEAGVLPHWCVCLQWRHLAADHRMYRRVAAAFLHYANNLTETHRDKCVLRTLASVKWVTMKQNRMDMIAFVSSADADGYVPKLEKAPTIQHEYYQIQVELGPGAGLYEATADHELSTDRLTFHERDVSRINAYGEEPRCIIDRCPHLAKYCYCK